MPTRSGTLFCTSTWSKKTPTCRRFDVQKLMAVHRSGDHKAKLALHEAYYPAMSAAILAQVDGFIDDIDRLIKRAD